MKHLLFALSALLAANTPFAQSASGDSAALHTVVKGQEAAWNRHDWTEFSSRFTDDGTLINFVGQFWKSRNEILANFTQLNEFLLPTSLSFGIDRIRFLTEGIAIVYVKEVLVATKDFEVPFQKYKKGDKDYKMITLVCIKKDSNWKITSMQVSLINLQISPQNQDK